MIGSEGGRQGGAEYNCTLRIVYAERIKSVNYYLKFLRKKNELGGNAAELPIT